MFQRTLMRSSRAANATLKSRSALRLQTASPFFLRTQTQVPRLASRWYSEAAEAKDASTDAQKDAAAAGDAQAQQPAEVEQLKKQLEEKKKEVVDLKDKYLRSVAEFRNLQERTKREVDNAKNYAITKFAKDLIESVDNFDRALSTVPAESIATEPSENETQAERDLRNLHSGLKMTETILMSTLKKHGLERIDPAEKGEKFDPNLHEAVFQVPQPGKEDGTVMFTQQKGFILNGRVIRAPKVGVVKNS